jgi:hypothetical protein
VNYRWEIERAEMEYLLEGDRVMVIDAARRVMGIRGGWIEKLGVGLGCDRWLNETL